MKDKGIRIKNTIKQHIANNLKEYIIVTIIFIIGIFLGVLFINNVGDSEKQEITGYLNSFIEKMKNIGSLDYGELLETSIWQNVLTAIVIWFFGTTVIGIPIVFGLVLYRGFCLGYTIASCIVTFGTAKGISFIFTTIFLQNILLVPAILAISVSGFKLYKSIVKEKTKENIKLEIIRHTVFSFIMLLLMVLSSVIEIFISTNLLKNFAKYF